jgi:hypothetical protein
MDPSDLSEGYGEMGTSQIECPAIRTIGNFGIRSLISTRKYAVDILV